MVDQLHILELNGAKEPLAIILSEAGRGPKGERQ
jgi:hypothetical protein